MQAFAYIRVSTDRQAEEGISLEAQEARINAWCLANGADLAGVFIDAGISGKKTENRPQLRAALEAVCKAGGVLVVYSLSRLARSTKDTLTIGERLEKAGADLVSLSEKIDTTSAAGKMVFRMLAVLAEFERDLVSERTRGAMAHKKSCGERVGTVPFGFDCANGIDLTPNADEQAVLALVKQLREAGLTMRAIAADLTSRRIPTKKGGTVWTHSTVQSLLARVA